MKKAEEILAENIEAWGEGRERFLVPPDEMEILANAGGSVIDQNDNGDGTFTVVLRFQEHTFVAYTTTRL